MLFRLTLMAAAALATLPAAASSDPLAEYTGKHRVLLVSAPSPDDPNLGQQRKTFVAMQDGAKERDLALVVAVGDDARARALRSRFGLTATAFGAVLVGKDGGAKLKSATPLGPDQLFPVIDAMPMRQDEIKQ